MAHPQTISLDATDRLGVRRKDDRMPYYLAVPVWIALAAVAWSPVFLLIRFFT